MKSIVITGSTSGIGYGLADSFLSLGCSVTISGRFKENIEAAISKLSDKYEAKQIFGLPCDVTDYSQVQELWDTVNGYIGKVWF